jgi:hypothetical protein
MSKRSNVVPLEGWKRLPDGSREFHVARIEKCPSPPKWLTNARAREVFKTIARELHDRAELTVLHPSCLAPFAMCVSHGERLDAAGEHAEAREWWKIADAFADDMLIPRPNRSSPSPRPAA